MLCSLYPVRWHGVALSVRITVFAMYYYYCCCCVFLCVDLVVITARISLEDEASERTLSVLDVDG